ncbi:MAG TPA: Wzz/FepE/Etk N-terminal domain-containing protein, partial [Gaiellaceae bacterium]
MSSRDQDHDAEQEVDLGRYWHVIVSRWWLPLAGLVAGAIIGYLISLGGKQVWKASANVYLGASYSAVGGILLQGPQANPSTVNSIARAEISVTRAAQQAGMSP